MFPNPGVLSSSLRGKLRPIAVVVVHALLFVASGYASFLLRFEFAIPSWQIQHLAYALVIWLVVKTLVFE